VRALRDLAPAAQQALQQQGRGAAA